MRCDLNAVRRAVSAGLLALGSLLVLAPLPAVAHKSSDAYLFIDVQPDRSDLRWDIALRDLDVALALDADGNRDLTWGEIRAAWPRIDALALASLAVESCLFAITGHALEQRNDGAYAVLQLSAPCQIAPKATLHYSLFAELDPTHRGIVRQTQAGGAATLRMLVPAAIPSALRVSPAAQGVAGLALTAVTPTTAGGPIPLVAGQAATGPGQGTPAGPASAAIATAAAAPTAAAGDADPHAPSFTFEGVRHILTGYDHLLFLLCLLLPSVLRRHAGQWQAVAGWREALLPVAKTVTLFTLAHSVTLALAALGWVKLSPSFVEPAIAATIMLAAVDNLRPVLLRWRGWVTFVFGLIHGFGFAGVLGELQLPPAQFGWALFQFNLGLELGQLCLVLAVVPLLFMLRRHTGYVPGVLRGGSALALLLAAVWLVERTSDWRLLPS